MTKRDQLVPQGWHGHLNSRSNTLSGTREPCNLLTCESICVYTSEQSQSSQARKFRSVQARARNYFKDLKFNPLYTLRDDGSQIKFNTNRAHKRRLIAGSTS